MGRSFHVISSSQYHYQEPDYYQFNNEGEIKTALIKHISKLTTDTQWSKTSWFGFLVNTNLKDEKIDGLKNILAAINNNSINFSNYMAIIQDIENIHPNLHSGGFFSEESHKIVKGIKMFYQNQTTNVELQKGVNKSY